MLITSDVPCRPANAFQLRAPAIISDSYQNIRLHTGARVNIELHSYLRTYDMGKMHLYTNDARLYDRV